MCVVRTRAARVRKSHVSHGEVKMSCRKGKIRKAYTSILYMAMQEMPKKMFTRLNRGCWCEAGHGRRQRWRTQGGS